MLDGCAFVAAHNAPFDMGFCGEALAVDGPLALGLFYASDRLVPAWISIQGASRSGTSTWDSTRSAPSDIGRLTDQGGAVVATKPRQRTVPGHLVGYPVNPGGRCQDGPCWLPQTGVCRANAKDCPSLETTLPLAFSTAARVIKDPSRSLERKVRLEAAKWFRKQRLVPEMIERIKELIDVNDGGGHS